MFSWIFTHHLSWSFLVLLLLLYLFFYTGIIPFSRLRVFYANLGSAEIFFVNRKRGPRNKWQINIRKHTSVPNVGRVDILNGFSVSTCK